jgi:MscS family membrane protein
MDKLRDIINTTFWSNAIWQYLLFFGCIVLAIIVGKIFYYISKVKLRKLTAKSKSKLLEYLIDIIEEPLVLLIVTGGIWAGSRFLTLTESVNDFFLNIVQVLIAVTITWFLMRLVDTLIRVYVQPMVDKTESRLDDQILPILRKSAKTVIVLLSAIVVLSNLGYDILSILAGLGIGGLALALAAQDAVKNVIGGVSIFWDKPFQIGDWVEIAGKQGTVAEVGLRSTRLRTLGHTTYVIPNSKVADSALENFSTRQSRRMVVAIGLTYETTAMGMEKAIQIIIETIKKIDGTNHDDIMVRFINFGAYSLDLEVVYWITDMVDWKMVIHRVNMALKKNLEEAGVDMAFPTETHYVINQNGSS